jgi:hypothetical protein
MFINTNFTQFCVSLLEHSQFCMLYFSAQLWLITVEVVVWTHHDDMLEFQHPAPRVARPQRQAAVHIGVTHSFGTLPLVPVTIIQPVTCHHISEALMLAFTDTGKVSVRHCDKMKWGRSSEAFSTECHRIHFNEVIFTYLEKPYFIYDQPPAGSVS